MSALIVNKNRLLGELSELANLADLDVMRNRLWRIRQALISFKRDELGLLNIHAEGDAVQFDKTSLLENLDQIRNAKTLERAQYYVERLRKGIDTVRTNSINDINLNRWKEYNEILTDSLWIMDKRDNSAGHSAWYWGNYIPQIPRQLMVRYSKVGEWVLDPFAGSGTTLIECLRMGRNGYGVDINPETVRLAQHQINSVLYKDGLISDNLQLKDIERPIIKYEVGDSSKLDFKLRLKDVGASSVQLLLLHPPYHDIIKFGDDPRDLSGQTNLTKFIQLFEEVLDRVLPVLDKGRYLGLVIGDKYSSGEWIPLSFYCMQAVQGKRCTLKSIIVKNFEETTGKRNQKELWRYRALVGGFYVFKHEYIMIFKKR